MTRASFAIQIARILASLSFLTSCQDQKNTKTLENEIKTLELQLANLPEFRINPTPATLGYRSNATNDPEQTVTIHLDFLTPGKLDLIALAPTIYSPDSRRLSPLAFPIRFTIEAQQLDGNYLTVVDYSDRDYQTKGIEPQLFHLETPVQTKALRITCLKLGESLSWWTQKHVATLSEVMAFEGNWNLAQGARVRTSSDNSYGHVWNRACLTDGLNLLSPVDGNLRNPFDDFYYNSSNLTLLIDLGETKSIDELRLWPVVHSLQMNFPQASGIGFPESVQLEHLASPDSRGGRVIAEQMDTRKLDSSLLTIRFPPIKGRYFRLTLRNPKPEFRIERPPRIALGEIQLLSKGIVESAKRKTVMTVLDSSNRSSTPPYLSRLNDGLTAEGQILSLREWVLDLALRSQTENQLARSVQDLKFSQRQGRERQRYLIAIALALIPFLLWIARLVAERQWKSVRDQIACDLHDEIGANASCLVHMTELISESIPSKSEAQSQLLTDTIATARLTSQETRDFVRFLETKRSDFDVRTQILTMARQMLAELDYECTIDRNARLRKLSPTRQWDFLLFIKESLNNILKHSDAQKVEIKIERSSGRIHLDIYDDGLGIPSDSNPPLHLKSRADRLGSNLNVTSSPSKGTRIQLTF